MRWMLLILLKATVDSCYGSKDLHVKAPLSSVEEGENITLTCVLSIIPEDNTTLGENNGTLLQNNGTFLRNHFSMGKNDSMKNVTTVSNNTSVVGNNATDEESINVSASTKNLPEVKNIKTNSSTYSWLFNGQLLSGAEGKELFLQDVTWRETGVYSCRMRNAAANISLQSWDKNITVLHSLRRPLNVSFLWVNTTSFHIVWSPPPMLHPQQMSFSYSIYYKVSHLTHPWTKVWVGDVQEYTLTGLWPGTQYDVQIAALNEKGEGSNSTIVRNKTVDATPSKVVNLTAFPSFFNLNITWMPPVHINGVLRGYNVSYSLDGGELTPRCVDTLQLYCLISDVRPGRKYTVVVTVSNYLSTASSVINQSSLKWPAEFKGMLQQPMNVTSNSFIISFNVFQAPIWFYDVIVKELEGNHTPLRPPSNYTTKEIFQKNDKGLYIAGRVLSTDAEQDNLLFVVGQVSNGSQAVNVSLPKVTGKMLSEGRYYTVFVRGYVDESLYQSTAWYPVVLTLRSSTPSNNKLGIIFIVGVIAGGVTLLCLIAVAVACCIKARRQSKKKMVVSAAGGIDGRRFSLSLRRNREALGGANDPRVPVPIDGFREHVYQLKANNNYKLSLQYSWLSRDLNRAYNNSRQMENNLKNRYHNVPAYDETRVILEILDNDPNSDYINANFIDGFNSNREYIATQGPLPETVFDFWRMVWENDVSTIIMLTKLEERGRLKCAQYWPDDHINIKDFVITSTEVREFPDHIARTFHITRTEQAVEKITRQFQFLAWPDFGVPEDPSALLCFIRKVNKWRLTSTPSIVHCSAGVGRTGTYITIDTQMQNIRQNKEITIYNNVEDLRSQRCLMVQTEDQFMFIHDAILDYLELEDTEVDASELSEYIHRKCEVDSQNGMSGLFEEFILLANTDKKDEFTEANKPMNQSKNRYKNILPYDNSRVVLSPYPGVEGSDYINASFLDSYLYKDHFIATQTPLEETGADFWRMAWEHNTVVLVMLIKDTDISTGDFFAYWPQETASIKLGFFIIEVNAETTYGDYIHREVKVTNTETSLSRLVHQFQYTTWPDTGLPETGLGLVELIGQVRRKLCDDEGVRNKTIIVHCSGGAGRTGVFIALSNLIERVKVENLVDVFQTIKRMRLQRTAMVQTKDQYEFIYRVVQEYLTSFDLYTNFSSRESSVNERE